MKEDIKEAIARLETRISTGKLGSDQDKADVVAVLTAAKDQAGQISRIIMVEENRGNQLRGNHPWHPAVWADRPDFLAWRMTDLGGIEILTYNNGFGDPISVVAAPLSYKPEGV